MVGISVESFQVHRAGRHETGHQTSREQAKAKRRVGWGQTTPALVIQQFVRETNNPPLDPNRMITTALGIHVVLPDQEQCLQYDGHPLKAGYVYLSQPGATQAPTGKVIRDPLSWQSSIHIDPHEPTRHRSPFLRKLGRLVGLENIRIQKLLKSPETGRPGKFINELLGQLTHQLDPLLGSIKIQQSRYWPGIELPKGDPIRIGMIYRWLTGAKHYVGLTSPQPSSPGLEFEYRPDNAPERSNGPLYRVADPHRAGQIPGFFIDTTGYDIPVFERLSYSESPDQSGIRTRYSDSPDKYEFSRPRRNAVIKAKANAQRRREDTIAVEEGIDDIDGSQYKDFTHPQRRVKKTEQKPTPREVAAASERRKSIACKKRLKANEQRQRSKARKALAGMTPEKQKRKRFW